MNSSAAPKQAENEKPERQQKTKSIGTIGKNLLRLSGLSFLGALIGFALGNFYYLQLPPRYRANATIRLNNSTKHDSTVDSLSNSHLDELVVIQSVEVLRLAVKTASLAEHRRFYGKTDDEIIHWLKSGPIEVRLPTSAPTSNVLAISATTDDSELSGVVLQAVIAGYEQYLKFEKRFASNQRKEQLNILDDYIERQKSQVQSSADQLKSKSNLLWKDEIPSFPSLTRYEAVERELIELECQKIKLESLLEHANEGLSNGLPVDEMLVLLRSQAYDLLLPHEETDPQAEFKFVSNTIRNHLGVLERERNKFEDARKELDKEMRTSSQDIYVWRQYQSGIEELAKESREVKRLLLDLESLENATVLSQLEISYNGGFIGPNRSRYTFLGAFFGLISGLSIGLLISIPYLFRRP